MRAIWIGMVALGLVGCVTVNVPPQPAVRGVATISAEKRLAAITNCMSGHTEIAARQECSCAIDRYVGSATQETVDQMDKTFNHSDYWTLIVPIAQQCQADVAAGRYR